MEHVRESAKIFAGENGKIFQDIVRIDAKENVIICHILQNTIQGKRHDIFQTCHIECKRAPQNSASGFVSGFVSEDANVTANVRIICQITCQNLSQICHGGHHLKPSTFWSGVDVVAGAVVLLVVVLFLILLLVLALLDVVGCSLQVVSDSDRNSPNLSVSFPMRQAMKPSEEPISSSKHGSARVQHQPFTAIHHLAVVVCHSLPFQLPL